MHSRLMQQVEQIAALDSTVFIGGETGTGKSTIARMIHELSSRQGKTFMTVACGALPPDLIESELFGHVKGAFTDAISDRVGRFEYANGGTLFLDEIGDMPMPTQIKLLRVLEEREITRVGDNKPIPVNVRVLAATNKDLEHEIEEGRFRSDLFFRLNMFSVHIDPLNQRRDDILPLADYFRKQANKAHGRNAKGFSPELRKWLLKFTWKGNVRQLKNVVESMVVMDLDEMLDLDDLSPDLLEGTVSTKRVKGKDDANIEAAVSDLIGKPLKEIERWATEETLKMANYNRKETAAILGISERNLYRMIDKYGLK